MRIAVAGGTGTIGRHAVDLLRRAGHEVVVLTTSTGVDLTTGRGLEGRLVDCHRVLDLSNTRADAGREQSEAFFSASARNLLSAAHDAGVGHIAFLSIVGADVVDLGYYHGKRRQEELVTTGPLPWTLLRATQLHEFAAQLLDVADGPVVYVPPMLTQPVAAIDVATRLVELVTGPARGTVPPIAGPDALWVADMARRVLARRGVSRQVETLPVSDALALQLAGGDLVPEGEFLSATTTFGQYLDGLVPAGRV